jgi:HlyD family secretion protein
MKILRVVLVILLLGVILVSGISCNSKSTKSTTAAGSTVATVQRGNLEIDITATGNLALSEKEDLAFEMAGTVDEVLVDAGDKVTKGQVLAGLDDSAWQDTLDTLKNAVTTAQRSQTTKERALTTALRTVETRESALATAKRLVATRELALRQAQLNLQAAEYNLNQIADVKKAQNMVDSAQAQLNLALTLLDDARKSGDPAGQLDTLRMGVNNAQLELTAAKDYRTMVLTNSGVRLTYDVATDVQTKVLAEETAKKAVDDAQIAIDDARTAIVTAQNNLDDARTAIDDARTAIDDAKKGVSDAQKNLDEALAKSTEIKAPFDGFITAVNAEGGEEVNRGFVACTIADPNKFESYILVSEMDISKVKTDGAATVSVDSLGGMNFPAKVTHIAPTATVQSGVVNFRVKVELESLTPVQTSQQSAAPGAPSGQTPGQTRQGVPGGQTPEQLRQAIAEGRITQEQVAAMAERFRQGAGSQQSSAAATSSQSVQLREGLTVTVNIVVDKKTNVLLVPNKAITTEGRQSYVQVILPDGKTEKRAVTKGISDWQNTEITQGLSEGEQVMVLKGTTTSSSTSTSQPKPQQMPIMIPGAGPR